MLKVVSVSPQLELLAAYLFISMWYLVLTLPIFFQQADSSVAGASQTSDPYEQRNQREVCARNHSYAPVERDIHCQESHIKTEGGTMFLISSKLFNLSPQHLRDLKGVSLDVLRKVWTVNYLEYPMSLNLIVTRLLEKLIVAFLLDMIKIGSFSRDRHWSINL